VKLSFIGQSNLPIVDIFKSFHSFTPILYNLPCHLTFKIKRSSIALKSYSFSQYYLPLLAFFENQETRPIEKFKETFRKGKNLA